MILTDLGRTPGQVRGILRVAFQALWRQRVTRPGVVVDASVTLLVGVLSMLVDLLFRLSALVGIGRWWSPFDGPVTAPTAWRRPEGTLRWSPVVPSLGQDTTGGLHRCGGGRVGGANAATTSRTTGVPTSGRLVVSSHASAR